MLLTLEVISPNGELLGNARRKTVGPEGAQIGRSKECDWVINDQYISRTHARIRYVSGAFYIEGTGRNPLAINDPEQTIPNNEPHLLRNGDRFFLDQYEIRVGLSTGGAASQTIPDDPFAPAVPAGAAVPQSWGSGIDAGIADGTLEDAANLDPLAALGGPAKPTAAFIPVNIHQGSVLEDSYQPQAPMTPRPVVPPPAAATPSSGGKIPDSWERSGLTQMGQQPAPTPPPPKRPSVTPAKPSATAPSRAADDDSIPDVRDKGRTRLDAEPATQKLPPLAQLVQDAAAQRTVPPNPPERPRPAAPQPPSVPPTTRRTVEAPPPPPPASTAATAQHRALSDAAQQAPSVGGSIELEELLRAAGVPASQMSPEMARELGQVLRIVVQGLMEVLQSRAEIKSQLRMSMTRMQPTENNPLKFSPNVEAALHTLLVERNRGYLPTVRAFQEALTDIRNHQIAVLQGIRTAFSAMLEQFDPEKIDAELEKPSKRGGLLNIGGKGGKFREQYVEQYESMTRDPDEAFKRLFGEFFAQAYEEQMDRLKMTGRTAGDGQ
ncbi:MAG TPA: type VI secretion system-associated FHA domain protein TagH [Povalibacter sp.]